MSKNFKIIVAISLFLAIISISYLAGRISRSAPITATAPTAIVKTDMIEIDAPLPQALISSPLTITGKARGTWFFEASFPVKLVDANGHELSAVGAQAQGDWMTEDFVPFKAIIIFPKSTTPTGAIILEKDNPSGLPANAGEVRIPVRFSGSAAL